LRYSEQLLSNQTGRLSLWFVLYCGLDHVSHGEFTCHAMPQWWMMPMGSLESPVCLSV